MQPMKMDPSPMLKDYIDMKCEEGKKEGMKKGMEEVAKKMLQKHVDVDTIMEFTGLPRDVIVQLQQK